jgi:predicted transcriptional regulator YheO
MIFYTQISKHEIDKNDTGLTAKLIFLKSQNDRFFIKNHEKHTKTSKMMKSVKFSHFHKNTHIRIRVNLYLKIIHFGILSV